jgi:hypothetical protein
MEGGTTVFHAFYAPAFPHPKNIYASFFEADAINVFCLVNKINPKDWVMKNPKEWKLALVANQKKFVLIVKEIGATFHATAPMLMYAYGL